MQHTLNLIAQYIPESEKVDMSSFKVFPNKQCAITGIYTDCIERKKALSQAFTAQAKLLYNDSDFVSISAFQGLKYRPERAASWIVSEMGFQRLNRVEIRPLVLNKPQFKTWSGYATTSYKKHGSMLTPVNTNDRAIWVFETLIVDCSDVQKVNGLYHDLLSYLKKGFGRPILESGEVPAFLISKLGVNECMMFERWAKKIINSNLYQFLCYLLPSQAELNGD